jgi:hypothetical protein
MRIFRKLARQPWESVDAACRDYVDSCTRVLSRFRKGNETPCAVPYQFHIVRRMCAHYGIDLGRAWDMPYSVARCYSDAVAESDGDDSLMSVRAQRMEDEWPQSQH